MRQSYGPLAGPRARRSAFGGGDDPAEQVVHTTTVDFLDAYLEDDDAALGRLQRDGNVANVAALQAEA